MRVTPLLAIASITSATIAPTVFAQSPNADAPAKACYPPQYTAAGELLLPKNFYESIYVGSPLTPNALNDGHANFPWEDPTQGWPRHNTVRSSLVNKVDLAPQVGADLKVMEADALRMRTERPFILTNLKSGEGADQVASLVIEKGGLVTLVA